MAQVYWNDVSEGQELPALDEEMSSQRLVVWAAASGDFYQIHFDDDFAKGNNLPDIIVHGALKGMLVGRLIDEWIGDEGRIVQWGVSYRGMDPARQNIRVWGKVTKKYEQGGEGLVDLEVGCAQPNGTETTPGTATVMLPKR
ncbi:MAG: MaoC/PaaZ C-terminal domain-containing protein [Chloroflexi bacterium]|nr:MaoC/PaaZ C-terminal domain-containing protein [Chloroflexota bacterium]MDA1002050.1 MaoC/PaaZ C-terminal domain-containing protein [Chloroflexota bacterium]MQC27563.1 dehydratase [Chloroflexota bacterium]